MVALLDSDYFICTADYIGYGFSEKPYNYVYDMFEHAEVIAGMLRKTGLTRFSYLTHD
jgi:hypothetical protein